MNHTDIGTAARLLLSARANGTELPGLPPECVPRDAGEAYAIQDAVNAAMGPVGGWKVGAKGADAPPSCAPLPQTLVHPAPAAFRPSASGKTGIEVELAVRLGQDLPPRALPYTRDEVISAIESIHPAVEIVSYRLDDHGRQHPLSVLADALGNDALLVGTASPGPVAIDQTAQPVELYFNGEKRVATVGGNAAGDIFRLLVWLANHAAQRCGGLRAGQIVTTGTCTGLIQAEPGTQIRAVFPGVGSMEFLVAGGSA